MTHWLKYLVCILGQEKAWMFSGTVCDCMHACMVEDNTEWVVHTNLPRSEIVFMMQYM